MPPVITTHSLFDTATATRIESMAKTMSVNSTLTTVAQKGDSPSQGSRRLDLLAILAAGVREEMLVRQIQQVEAADQLHPSQVNQVRRERRGQ